MRLGYFQCGHRRIVPLKKTRCCQEPSHKLLWCIDIFDTLLCGWALLDLRRSWEKHASLQVLDKLLFTSMDFVRTESAVLTEAVHIIKVQSTTSPTVKFQFRSIGEARLDNVAALTAQVHPKHLDWGFMCLP